MSSVSHTGDQDSILRLQVGNSWAEVALYGSTVIGWHCENHSSDKDKSLIFLSRDTKPGKPFRGGIPLVFPVFGEVKDHANVPDTLKDAPRHGFCRDRNWIVTEKHDQDASKASVTMSLSSNDDPSLLEKFPFSFALKHTVTLTKDSLECQLKLQHQSNSQHEKMPFHALFHNYLAVPSTTATASGLKGIGFRDKVAGGVIVNENEADEQGWNSEIDRVYRGSAPSLIIAANDGTGNEILLQRSDTIPDTTLWNPGQAADQSMADLHTGGWREFVCAEPGHVDSFEFLDRGQEWTASQKLTFREKGKEPSKAKSEQPVVKNVDTSAAAGAVGASGAILGGAAAASAGNSRTEPASSGGNTEAGEQTPTSEALQKTLTEHYNADRTENSDKSADARAARVIQRNYRAYVGRREADGLRLSPDTRWGDAMGRMRLEGASRAAKDGNKNDANSRWKRGGLLVGQLAGSPSTGVGNEGESGPVDGGPSLKPSSELQRTAPDDNEKSNVDTQTANDDLVGNVPGGNENGKVDNIRSIAHKHQYGLKLIERWTRGAPAQELSKVMEGQYWLEMVDRNHRYGSNLKHYHAAWEKDTETQDNFFKWLDEGSGKDLDLPECPRDRLDGEKITYLSTEQRVNYIVDVKDGRLIWRRNGKPVDTSRNRWRDMGHGRGIVELGPEEQEELKRQREENAARHGKSLSDDSSNSSSSSSDDSLLEDNEEKAAAHHYGGESSKSKHHINKFTTAGMWDNLLRKTVRDNTWIYVYNQRHELFIGIKKTGNFQHSSFLYGGRVLSAGLLRAKDGYLTSLSPLSGHYRAGTAHFRYFVASLQDSGVNLDHVTLSKSLMMLRGLEAYGKLNKKIKGGAKANKGVERKAVQKDGSTELSKNDSHSDPKSQANRLRKALTPKSNRTDISQEGVSSV